jgi:RNA polymerase sigma factor (sigma-70 family)
MHSEHYLIQALLDNDRKTIRHIYDTYSEGIRRWVRHNQGNSDDAKDVFQEALIAIARQAQRPDFQLRCPFGAYLYLVCRGKWLNELRRRQREQVTIREMEGYTPDMIAVNLAEETLQGNTRQQLFQSCFEQLPEGCRTLLRLSWTGISMEEVGHQLGVTYGYARKRKAECIAQLTRLIQSSPGFSSAT